MVVVGVVVAGVVVEGGLKLTWAYTCTQALFTEQRGSLTITICQSSNSSVYAHIKLSLNTIMYETMLN